MDYKIEPAKNGKGVRVSFNDPENVPERQLAQAVVITLLQEDEESARVFLMDIHGAYSAEMIVCLFQNLSHLLYDIFVGISSAYLFYRLYQKPHDDEAQRKFAAEATKQIEKNQEALKRQLEKIESALRKTTNASHQKRFEVLRKVTEPLLHVETASKHCTRLYDQVDFTDPQVRERFRKLYGIWLRSSDDQG